MQCPKYSLLVTILCISYGQVSAAGLASLITVDESTVGIDTKDNETISQPIGSGLVSSETNLNITDKDFQSDDKVNLKSEKRDIENITFSSIKPLLLFPILPFLFPQKEEISLTGKNETSGIGEDVPKGKPFIFFDFAFNIRRIPFNNISDNFNDSKIIKVEKMTDENIHKESALDIHRRRRNTKMDTPGFFDDTSFFPESELDEFLPKPDFFFPDLAFHHKPSKKLSRRKRNQKKTELKNDFKSLLDAFDEAFMRTKREFEWADPILNFLRGGEQPFEEEKKETTSDLFGPVPEIRKEPIVKWKIQRNIKRLNDHKDGLTKDPLSPTIIVDKVVKIGELRMHDDNKSKKNRKSVESEKPKFGQAEETSKINEETILKTNLEYQDGARGRKRSYLKSSPEETNVEKKRSSLSKLMTKLNKKNNEIDLVNFKTDNETANVREMVKMMDSLKGRVKLNFETLSQKGKLRSDELMSNRVQEGVRKDLQKNLTQLLEQFLSLNKNLYDAKLLEKLQLNQLENAKILSQKETLKNGDSLENGPVVFREKKDANFEDEYLDSINESTRHFADTQYMFVTVCIPTLSVFGLLLILCFIALRVKGKICTKLFQPQQVLVLEDDANVQLTEPTSKKGQPI